MYEMEKGVDKATLIEIYRPLIEERLIPTQIITHFDFLSEYYERIKNEETNKSAKDAAKTFLDVLTHCSVPGWYEKFRQALIQNDYEYLVKLLDGFSDIKNERIPQAIMKNIAPHFVEMVKPTDIMPYLLQHNVIDSSVAAEIIAIDTSKGPFYASFTLFLRVGCKSEDWFPKLVFALKTSAYEYILEDYLPDLTEKETYDDIKKVVDDWIEKYEDAEDDRRLSAKTSAKTHNLTFDDNESEQSRSLEDAAATSIKDIASKGSEEKNEFTVPQVNPQELQLRPYQGELIEAANDDKNALLVAPTGSGKTHMALGIIQKHFDEENANMSKAKRVAFFVPTKCLVWQQWKMCKEFLCDRRSIGIRGAIQPGHKQDLGQLLSHHDIFVMTPQILVDALKEKVVKHLGEFSLLIFDECHHAMKRHPYNDILEHYRIEGRQRRMTFSLPQVIGLTASVGVGKSKDVAGAREYILKLCANLDSPVVQIKRETENLAKFVNNPYEKTWEFRGRQYDPFYNEVSKIMQLIEADLQYSPEGKEILRAGHLDLQVLQPVGKHGTEQYKQWLSHLDLRVSQIPSEKRRLLYTCCRHLVIYNNGLILNADCRAQDALDYLSQSFGSLYEHITEQQMDKTDRKLIQHFKEKESLLIKLSRNPLYTNPKLDGLKCMIIKQMEQNENSRGMVFCRTRMLSVALAVWASEDRDLKVFGVTSGRLTGAKVAEDKGGMSQGKQDQVIMDFKSGGCRLLIATSVGQEGIDIPDCNFVINYEHVTNEIARIQARGRGRAEGAVSLTIGETGRGTISLENMNKVREQIMKIALNELTSMAEDDIKNKYKIYQKEMSKTGHFPTETESPEKPRPKVTEIACKCCNGHVCFADELRLVKKAHHIILNSKIWERVKEKPHKKPCLMSDELWKHNKIHCKGCGQDWGIGAQYKETKFAILKKGDSLVYQNTNKSNPQPLREWKDLPFGITDLTDQEFDDYKLDLQMATVLVYSK